MNVAKIHHTTKKMGKIERAVGGILIIAKNGVMNRGLNIYEAISIRDIAEGIIGEFISMSSELEKLDKDSPCLKCDKIK